VAITPNTARMLACDAAIIPAVLGSDAEILDLGRATRTWTRAQRKAAKLRDRGCVFPRCQTGLDRCDLHHLDHWANGGPTDHNNSAHVCNYHHWLVHHTNWTITRNKHGTIEVRRT
ncbi:MAG: HNH endonuclease signature motif containing protein, partial [Mycobacteriales bacterium]